MSHRMTQRPSKTVDIHYAYIRPEFRVSLLASCSLTSIICHFSMQIWCVRRNMECGSIASRLRTVVPGAPRLRIWPSRVDVANI